MNNFRLINKKIIEKKFAKISIEERGFKFGDGIFETCKIYQGIIYDYKSHQDRIEAGLKALQIDFDIKNLKENCQKLIKKNKIKNGILRIYISRGIGSMGYLPAKKIKSLLVVETFKERKVRREKIRLGISKIKLYPKENFLQNCKTAQSLNYILAKIEARKNNNFDDVMISFEGLIGECSSSNIFWIKNQKIFTSSAKSFILEGLMRKKIIENFDVKIIDTKIDDLINADEVFITNSNLLILGVDEIIIDKKIIKYRKDFTKNIINFIKNDLENYVRNKLD